jgi:tetraacyldisaccharide 4'-kinase
MQVLLLDDGFQHRRLRRDLDLVLIDATDTKTASHLLPLGLRREPLSSLSRAHAVIMTRVDMAAPETVDHIQQSIARSHPHIVFARCIHRPQHLLGFPDVIEPLQRLEGQDVLAFCGIGNPAAFYATLERLGAKLKETRSWPDHHAYCLQDIEWLAQWAAQFPQAILVCTMKDWVKIQEPTIGQTPLLSLAISMEIIQGCERLNELIDALPTDQ